jgi:hypothetical protein
MNNTLKSAIPVAVISAVLVALFFVGYSFWFKERVLSEFAAKQKNDMDTLQGVYQSEMQKIADRVVARVDRTNETLEGAISASTDDVFLTDGDRVNLDQAKINALADAIMVKLNPAIPTAEDQARSYVNVSERVAERLDPILSEIARTGNLTRSDIEFFSSQITASMESMYRDELGEKQRLNNSVLETQAIADDALRLSQEMSALYLSSLKDEGVLSRILYLPVGVVKDVASFSIVGSSEREKVEERLFAEVNDIEQRLGAVRGDMPQAEKAAEEQAPSVEEVVEPEAPVRKKPTSPAKE